MSGRLKVLTLNLWGEQPPLERRMALVVQGLAQLAPDVVGLQEVREVPGKLENQAATLARQGGFGHVYVPTMPWGGGHEGLAILSRHPIAEQAVLELPHSHAEERRLLLSARVDTPAGAVWVHTTHLNYRLHHGRQREDQVVALEAAVASREMDTPQIILGDFNARPESDEIRWMSGLTTLAGRRVYYQDAWARLHPGEAGWTWAAANPYTAMLQFLEPDRRIDYVFVTPRRRDGRGAIHSCRIVLDQAASDGQYASDHYGLLAEVQIAPGSS